VRLGYDLSILRHPVGGTGRYARELGRAMLASAERGDDELVVLNGVPRWQTNRSALRRLRRVANLTAELGWLSIGAAWKTARLGLDAWFGPANVLPLALPRPLIVTIQDLNFLVHPTTYDPGYARYATRMYRSAVRRARRVLTSSDASRRLLIEHLDAPPERTIVIYPGVDHLAGPHTSADGPASVTDHGPARYALYVGQSEPHKNVGLLLEAWLAGVPSDLHLVICGPAGRDDARLRSVAGQASLRDRVHFLGLLDDAALTRQYRGARMFLFPSLSEGFGFPPLEAMALGVPTAVSTSGSLPEVTAGGALHFDPADAQALAQLVSRLDEDEVLRERLKGDGPRVAGTYRWADSATQVWREVRHAVSE
jgi:glycosyltransferase involved in cell wall biosynthesis